METTSSACPFCGAQCPRGAQCCGHCGRPIADGLRRAPPRQSLAWLWAVLAVALLPWLQLLPTGTKLRASGRSGAVRERQVRIVWQDSQGPYTQGTLWNDSAAPLQTPMLLVMEGSQYRQVPVIWSDPRNIRPGGSAPFVVAASRSDIRRIRVFDRAEELSVREEPPPDQRVIPGDPP